MKLKVFSSFLLSLVIVAFSVGNSFAEREISQTTLDSVSQNCSSIKLQLQRTQKEDSRLRVYLGSQYETISTSLMQNLNIRLVRNNISNPNLAEQQIQFASERDRFKEEFTAYSQELDKLTKIDCRDQPQKFYEKLQSVRTKRENVHKATQRLRAITTTHHETINQFIGDLKDGKN